MNSTIKKIIKMLIYGNKGSSETYIRFLVKNGCTIGKGTYIYDPKTVLIDANGLKFIKIGENVQITRGVIILGHDYSYSILSSVYKTLLRPQKYTIIGNNVFLGMNAIVLMGANVGDNVIVGAGSVVKGKLESNCVYAGNPAKKICTLDEYYKKCCDQFETSAKVYAQAFFDEYHRWPQIVENEFASYKTLIRSDDSKFVSHVGIPEEYLEEINKNMKSWGKYESVEDMMVRDLKSEV